MKGIDSHTPPCARAIDVGATIESTYGAGLGMTLAARSVLAASQTGPEDFSLSSKCRKRANEMDELWRARGGP